MIIRRRFISSLVILGSLAFVAQSLHAQAVDTIDPALKTRVDQIANDVLQQTGVPSASVAIVKGGKLVYTHAYGSAHLDPPVAATPDMRYSIGSISKQFTAAAILLLQEQGKLSLDDAVGKYVPGLTRGDEVTIRQILSHTSGYQDYWPEDYLMTPMLHPTPPSRSSTPGPKSRSTSSRARNGSTPTPTTSSPAHRRKSQRRKADGFSRRTHLSSARHEQRVELRRNQATQTDATPYIATPSARSASPPRKAAAGCLPPANWP